MLSADRWLREHHPAGETAGPERGRAGTFPHPAALPGIPRAFIEKQRGAMRILAVDERALALGIEPGTMLADARARVPELAATPHEPEKDARLLDWLIRQCDRYTPMAAADAPDGLVLDLTGCLHSWDGERALAADLAARLVRAGFTFRIALAETPDKARALARHGGQLVGGTRPPQGGAVGETWCNSPPDIRQLPVLALDLDADRLLALRRAGLATIGDLAVRPRAPLAARIGTAAVARLDRLLGREDVRISPRRPAPALFVMRRFAEPVARTEHVLGVLESLVAEAGVALSERGEGGRGFVATLYRSDGDIRDLVIETGAPTRDPALLARLFRERIDALADPLDPGFGYDAIRLAVPRTDPLDPRQEGLSGEVPREREMGALVDRLSTRLGPTRVRRLVAGNTHIPEAAATSLPAQGNEAAFSWPETEAGEPPLRPLLLFDPPHPVDVTAEVPDGPPISFRWRQQIHRVRLAEGPERIASEWWRRPGGYTQGKGGLTRDYFRVEDETGRRFWLFRHGLYNVETSSPRWYLHGMFA